MTEVDKIKARLDMARQKVQVLGDQYLAAQESYMKLVREYANAILENVK